MNRTIFRASFYRSAWQGSCPRVYYSGAPSIKGLYYGDAPHSGFATLCSTSASAVNALPNLDRQPTRLNPPIYNPAPDGDDER